MSEGNGFWTTIREWAYKYVGGLFMEEKDGKQVISIGRCLLILVVLWMMSFWSIWMSVVAMTPESLAGELINHLPENATVTGVDVLAAATKVVDAMPTAAPPLMGEAFLTACGYVFGSKAASIVGKRLNGR